jgi:serine/threonine-protein kinase
MFLAAYYIFNRQMGGEGYITVPDITDMSIGQAQTRLIEAGLECEIKPDNIVEIDEPNVPENIVMHQRPEPGSVVKRGRVVYPYLSKRPAPKRVPNVVGLAESEALEALGRENLETEEQTARVPHKEQAGTVIRQFPLPGYELAENWKVGLVVSAGPAEVPKVMVPKLLNMSLDEARIAAESDRFELRIVMVNDPGYPADLILGQRPDPGSILPEGSEVSVYIRPTQHIPGANYLVDCSFTVPPGSSERLVRFESVVNNKRTVEYPKPEHYQKSQHDQNGRPPLLTPGTEVSVSIAYPEELIVDIFLDNRKVRSVYYHSNSRPIVTDY